MLQITKQVLLGYLVLALKLQHLFTEHTTVGKNHCGLHKKVLLVKHRDEKIKIDFRGNKFRSKQTKAGEKKIAKSSCSEKKSFLVLVSEGRVRSVGPTC